jgi:hypothetical protein
LKDSLFCIYTDTTQAIGMSVNMTEMPKELSELINRFENNREAYRSGQYNETQLRREFMFQSPICPTKELGHDEFWDC